MLVDQVIFIDAEALLLDKPAGLPVDTPRSGGRSVEALAGTLRFGFERAPTAVHRLDRDTSGCLLLARNAKAHKRFAAAFEAGEASKIYLAVLDGVPAKDGGTIDMPLGKVSTREKGWRMVPDRRGKAAVTRWRVLGAVDGRALVEFRPTTGRTHQLRVHAAEGIGVPIAGDPVYGIGMGTMLLHALSLTVPRAPKAAIEGVAPLPESFAAWVHLLERGVPEPGDG